MVKTWLVLHGGSTDYRSHYATSSAVHEPMSLHSSLESDDEEIALAPGLPVAGVHLLPAQSALTSSGLPFVQVVPRGRGLSIKKRKRGRKPNSHREQRRM